jgi:hypothetical protein
MGNMDAAPGGNKSTSGPEALKGLTPEMLRTRIATNAEEIIRYIAPNPTRDTEYLVKRAEAILAVVQALDAKER